MPMDTKKRMQILNAAERVFFVRGYDRTSVDDLRREAGVSKGTIYAFFNGKEALFRAACENIHERVFGAFFNNCPSEVADRAWLLRFGISFARMMTSEPAILASRAVIVVADRMPVFGRAFFENGFRRALAIVTQATAIRSGSIGPIPCEVARSLLELFLAGTHRERLLGLMTEQEAHKQIPSIVERAIRTIFPE